MPVRARAQKKKKRKKKRRESLHPAHERWRRPPAKRSETQRNVAKRSASGQHLYSYLLDYQYQYQMPDQQLQQLAALPTGHKVCHRHDPCNHGLLGRRQAGKYRDKVPNLSVQHHCSAQHGTA
ncbi:hypothetical protein IF1G_06570 [Cordyceps javanica]|uniref:Uncharacterized protein n=1 Tax=Cordyceps javanica TaxID=43265 RepID=A0A545UYP5_9HYPO|nr:hypothetical protein IF1G_06570 [Cordyceps javanica]